MYDVDDVLERLNKLRRRESVGIFGSDFKTVGDHAIGYVEFIRKGCIRWDCNVLVQWNRVVCKKYT